MHKFDIETKVTDSLTGDEVTASVKNSPENAPVWESNPVLKEVRDMLIEAMQEG